jgi:glyoxylase-like metal-dependent hydrolase (beta-lactamase superfamily II)
MIKPVAQGIWKIIANSNLYVFPDKKLIIDTGDRQYHQEVEKDMKELIDPMEVKTVLLTHMHYDHIGNIDLFPNAEVFVSEEELKSYKEDAFSAVLSEDLIGKFGVMLKPLPDGEIEGFQIIKSPGHTVGSVCFYLKERKILFSGDTIFYRGGSGRTDLPNSLPDQMQETVDKVYDLGFEVLAPGHEY